MRRRAVLNKIIAGALLLAAVVALAAACTSDDEPEPAQVTATAPAATPSPTPTATTTATPTAISSATPTTTPSATATATPTPTPTPTATPTATPTPTPTATPSPTQAVSVSPGGTDVPRLATVTIAFNEPPPVADGAALVSIEPAIGGSFAWDGDRTLLFQPAFPGWERGRRYQVRVHAGAAALAGDHVHATGLARNAPVRCEPRMRGVLPSSIRTGVPTWAGTANFRLGRLNLRPVDGNSRAQLSVTAPPADARPTTSPGMPYSPTD